MIEKITAKMIAYLDGNRHDVAHFLKVFAYAQAIGLLEELDKKTQFTLETAAIVHDIACPFCRKKYCSAAGHLQEQESEALLRPFLAEFDLPEDIRERVIFLICHHHTYTNIDGADYQILLEADFLVNADESNADTETIRNFREKVFRTKMKCSPIRGQVISYTVHLPHSML